MNFKFEDVVDGIRREKLEAEIKKHHHRAQDVRPSDMGYLLSTFAVLQSEKGITPPIFDYDQTTRTIRVVDSTFYFFVVNIDHKEVLDNINDPIDAHK